MATDSKDIAGEFFFPTGGRHAISSVTVKCFFISAFLLHPRDFCCMWLGSTLPIFRNYQWHTFIKLIMMNMMTKMCGESYERWLRVHVYLLVGLACVQSQLKLYFLDRFLSAFMEWKCGDVILHVLLIGYDHVILSVWRHSLNIQNIIMYNLYVPGTWPT